MSSISLVLEQYGATITNTHRAGWVKMCCPFHPDKTASASVNHGLEKFHCFVCGIYEDPVGLVRKVDGVGYVEAVEKAEDITGTSQSDVPDESAGSDSLFDIPRDKHRRRNTDTSWRSHLA